MTDKDLINSLLRQAEEEYKTARVLFEEKRYNHALFFGHLVLEKLLKALVVKNTKKIYQPIHDLKKLAKSAEIKLSNEQEDDFDEITSFNLSARYDSEKLAFYKKANQEFTEKWFEKIKHYRKWLKNQF